MKNKLSDLNNHLFAELERLGDEEIKGEDLEFEVKRAKAVTDVANRVIDNARLAKEVVELKLEYGIEDSNEVLNRIGE